MSFRDVIQQHAINENDLRSQLRSMTPEVYAVLKDAYYELADGIVAVERLDPKALSDAPDVSKAIEEIQRAAAKLDQVIGKTGLGRYL